jgi:Prealbumin-like fold domain
MKTPAFSHSFISRYLSSTRRLALIAPIVFGFAVLVGYTVTAKAPSLLRLTEPPPISGSGIQAHLAERSYSRPSIHPLERLLLLSNTFEASVFTDKPNYQPGETAVITGSGFSPNEIITLQIIHIDDTAEGGEGHTPWNVAADAFGNFTSTWFVDPDDSAGSMFRLTATGNSSGLVAETTFTDGSANLDTCANGPFGAPVQCTGDNWQNGNLNGSKSHYFEGDSVPYRSIFEDLIPGNTYTITIEYDTTQGGLHALDYLTTFNATENIGNDPCTQKQGGSIVIICGPPSVTTPIPLDPKVALGQDGLPMSGDEITQLAGVFTLFNGTALSVLNLGSPYTLSGSYAGNSSTAITVQFTASAPTAVLAWAGHISTRKDWGVANSAIAINGSPYHMRLTDLDCSGVGEVCNVGNQDHQLSADAVFFPAELTIIKETNPDDAQVKTFNYTATGSNLGPFSLTPPNGTMPAQTVFNLTDTTARSVTESDPHAAAPQFDLTNLSCTQTDGGLGVGSLTTNLGTRTVSFTPKEGQFISCTFVNTEDIIFTRGRIIVDKVTNPGGDTTSFNFTPTYGSSFSLTDAATPNDSGLMMPGTYSVAETANAAYVTTATCTSSLGHPADNPSSIDLAAGEVVTCTFTNAKKPKLTVTKVVVNNNGGTKVIADFPLFVDAGSVASGVQNTFSAGSHTVSETTDPNYTSTISGDCASDGSITLAAGDVKACTITNDDKPAHLIIIKQVINDNGGTAVAGNFSGAITGVTASGGNTWTGTVAPGVDKTLTTIGAYNVTENAFSGYTASFSADCSGTIALGQTKTCTVTNDDNAAHLIIIKQVINDNGGAAVAGNFSGAITGVTASGGNTWTGTVAPGLDKTLTTVGAYNVTENAFSGYTASFSADCSGTIALGQTKTCTVTNDDDAAHLIIIKQVINDNGGTAVAGNFSGAITGVTASGGNTWTGTVAPGVNKTLTTVGAYTVTENAFTGYAASFSVYCSGTIALGQTKTCTVTNNDIAPTLRIIKDVVPDSDTGLFNLRIDGATAGTGANVGDNGTTGFVPVNAGGHTVSETAGTATTLSDYVSVIGGDCATNGSVSLALAQNKTCTITNTKKGMAQVIKTFNGGALGANSFTFQLRSGASAGAAGTILESGTANSGNSGTINFATKLVPGTTYQMCEQMQPGWLTTLGPPLYSVFNPSGDNSVVCTDFTVNPGQTKVFTINNQAPPGGMGLTIGFWKNWASCANSNGGQKPTLDKTLQLGDLILGSLVLHDTNLNVNVASDCDAVVNLLNKTTITGGKKMASDPIFNMVAQLVAADLNLLAGAGQSVNAMNVRSCAHALLVTINFNGNTYNKPLSAAQTTQANCLATQLDRYNNNLSVGTCAGCP